MNQQFEDLIIDIQEDICLHMIRQSDSIESLSDKLNRPILQLKKALNSGQSLSLRLVNDIAKVYGKRVVIKFE